MANPGRYAAHSVSARVGPDASHGPIEVGSFQERQATLEGLCTLTPLVWITTMMTLV